MKVFVAGGTGAIGRYLMPLLVRNGHEVVALARTAEKARVVEELGAKVAYADALNREELTAAIERGRAGGDCPSAHGTRRCYQLQEI
jgi:uncharacterized protein YbjT (DUF2867 family)